ncbi:MAG: hypothetical protein IKO20_04785 [Bacteroidaceae bacterium]|nr:hypothetical protein [Bacteroidaceae bacterium]
MKQKTYCSFRFDRKKQVEARGYGNVEVQIRLSPSVRTYIKIKVCTPKEWRTFSKSKELKLIMAKYESIALSIITSGEVITKESLNAYLGREVKEEVEELNKYDSYKPDENSDATSEASTEETTPAPVPIAKKLHVFLDNPQLVRNFAANRRNKPNEPVLLHG